MTTTTKRLVAIDPLSILREVEQQATPTLDATEWAQDEVEAAQLRHSESGQEGPIWNAFLLLKPTHESLEVQILFRAHARELLERVAAGEDTRPPTDAEVIAALKWGGLKAPLTSAAVCLFLRLFARALPTESAYAIGGELDREAYECVHGAQADEHEVWLRGKLSQPWRLTPDT